jgi:ATP-binding cassette subfamily B protein
MPAAPTPTWWRRLAGYCLRHRLDLFGSFGAALGGALVSVGVPLIIKHVIDLVARPAGSGPRPGIAGWVVLLMLAALVQYGLTFTRRFLAGRLSLDVQYDLRGDVFTALQRLDGAAQDALQTGQVVSRSISDVGRH